MSVGIRFPEVDRLERERLGIQDSLDAAKTQAEMRWSRRPLSGLPKASPLPTIKSDSATVALCPTRRRPA